MYKGCIAGVKSNGSVSAMFECQKGVRQGDVLSPNLFNNFVNDLPDCLRHCVDSPSLGDEEIQCLMYADDLVLMSPSAQGLQQQLNSLAEYCRKWELSVNKKTKVVILFEHYKCTDNLPTFQVNGQCLEIVTCYKYQGVELHHNLNWTSTSKNLCTRAWKTVHKLKSMSAGLDIPTR